MRSSGALPSWAPRIRRTCAAVRSACSFSSVMGFEADRPDELWVAPFPGPRSSPTDLAAAFRCSYVDEATDRAASARWAAAGYLLWTEASEGEPGIAVSASRDRDDFSDVLAHCEP